MAKEDLYSDDSSFDDEDEGKEDFESLAYDLFPDADPGKLKKLIRLCYEEDKKRDEESDDMGPGMGKGGIALILGGKPGKK